VRVVLTSFRRPVRFGVLVAVGFLMACAHSGPVASAPAPPAWVNGHPAEKGGRWFVVARGGPTGIAGDARRIALERGAADLARRRGEIRVVSRSYDHQREDGGDTARHQRAMSEESETLIKAVLEDLRVDAEWIDRDGRYTGVGGRVYYLLLSIDGGGS